MKKLLVLAALVVALLAPLAPPSSHVLAPPVAHAGNGYWSPGGCQPPPPVPVEWNGQPGAGSWYRSQFGTFWVGGGWYRWFQSDNWECGFMLGIPIGALFDLHSVSPLYYPGEWYIQDFYYGRLMRRFDGEWFIVRWSDGQLFDIGNRVP